MKHFTQTVWKSAQGPLQKLDNAIGVLPWVGEFRKRAKSKAISYALKPAFVRTFAHSGHPFLTFYEFNDLAGWCRDVNFAPDYVPGYADDAGVAYNVWTHEAVNIYRRHIILDELTSDIDVTFEIPSLQAASWFPLRISITDRNGLYFQTDQKLVVERIDQGGTKIVSWKKLPQLADCLGQMHALTQ